MVPLQATLLGLVASVLVSVLALQFPLVASGRDFKFLPILSDEDDDYTEWDLDELPNPNATNHLVFETVHSLLQHWPNTRMRNGHNIVPGIIPKGTLLYHGSTRNELPLGPEWVATDAEHSYIFCRKLTLDPTPDDPEEECWHHTLATTRPLRIIYFDGSSAAKLPYGPMDTQNLILWGESPPDDYVYDESERIHAFCNWFTKLGVDGVVRMAMDFEVMLCNLISGVNEVSSLNLNSPLRSEILPSASFEVINSGSWHARFPGETRIRLDLAGLVSFYDTQLVPSLIAVRAGQERWSHRSRSISNEDLLAVRSSLEVALSKPPGQSSGVDWRTLFQVMVDRFAGRLELTRHLLSSPATDQNKLLDLANKTQTQLRIMLTPYILLSATPTDPPDKVDLEWTKPVYRSCATTHTRCVEFELDTMTDSEKLLLRAIKGTSREICRVVAKMWAAGVYAGIDSSLNTKESPDAAEVARLQSERKVDLNRLMAWLDWSAWVKCDPDCGPQEMCYLPTWPIGFPSFPRRRRDRGPQPPFASNADGSYPERPSSFDFMATENVIEQVWSTVVDPEPDEWVLPQPKCIKRIQPYGF